MPEQNRSRYNIGAREGAGNLPGLTKVVEECGELIQVAGKIMALDGTFDHWDGTNLLDRLEDEIADVEAALAFFRIHNELHIRKDRIATRIAHKLMLFRKWHDVNRNC
jgi:NTP pyrophosphatase (non-canonical NTP hydrolase)